VSYHKYPLVIRRIEAYVEVNNEERIMVFITNNMTWAATSICALYKSRWGIETFFKEIKQTLQLSDFPGYNSNAVRWQVWIALRAYILIRFLHYLSCWQHSFKRLFTTIRALLWSRFDLKSLLDSYGTAHGPPRYRATPEQSYLPGLSY